MPTIALDKPLLLGIAANRLRLKQMHICGIVEAVERVVHTGCTAGAQFRTVSHQVCRFRESLIVRKVPFFIGLALGMFELTACRGGQNSGLERLLSSPLELRLPKRQNAKPLVQMA